jgi:uncharacterized protein (TIGR03435 family)
MVRFRRGVPVLFASWLVAQQTVAVHITSASANAQEVPQGQTAARGKMAFEVASIRPSAPGSFSPPNFPLSNDDAYKNVHGLFTADFPLQVYIEFAYKVRLSPEGREAMLAGLPKWVNTESFTIRARAMGEPTKDEMRRMMQALLADRFKLVVHYQTRVVPVLALTLDKPGKTGPNLRPHVEGPACDGTVAPTANGKSTPTVFPTECDVQAMEGQSDRRIFGGFAKHNYGSDCRFTLAFGRSWPARSQRDRTDRKVRLHTALHPRA